MAVDIFIQSLNQMEQRAARENEQAFALAQIAMEQESRKIDYLRQEKMQRTQQLDVLNNKLMELGTSGIENPVINSTLKSNIVSDAVDVKTDVDLINSSIDNARDRIVDLNRMAATAQQRFRQYATSPGETEIVEMSDVNQKEREALLSSLADDYSGSSTDDRTAALQLARNIEQPVYFDQLMKTESLDMQKAKFAAEMAREKRLEKINLLDQASRTWGLVKDMEQDAEKDLIAQVSPNTVSVSTLNAEGGKKYSDDYKRLLKLTQGLKISELEDSLYLLDRATDPADAYTVTVDSDGNVLSRIPTESSIVSTREAAKTAAEKLYKWATVQEGQFSNPVVREIYSRTGRVFGVSPDDMIDYAQRNYNAKVGLSEIQDLTEAATGNKLGYEFIDYGGSTRTRVSGSETQGKYVDAAEALAALNEGKTANDNTYDIGGGSSIGDINKSLLLLELSDRARKGTLDVEGFMNDAGVDVKSIVKGAKKLSPIEASQLAENTKSEINDMVDKYINALQSEQSKIIQDKNKIDELNKIISILKNKKEDVDDYVIELPETVGSSFLY